jgi:hypothetical protein
MKVVFKKTVLERLLEEKYEAERKAKTIDYFLLTPAEYNELRSDRYIHQYIELPRYAMWGHDPSEISPVSFSYVDLKTRDGNPYMTRRFEIRQEKILGERIVVAPKEYH